MCIFGPEELISELENGQLSSNTISSNWENSADENGKTIVDERLVHSAETNSLDSHTSQSTSALSRPPSVLKGSSLAVSYCSSDDGLKMNGNDKSAIAGFSSLPNQGEIIDKSGKPDIDKKIPLSAPKQFSFSNNLISGIGTEGKWLLRARRLRQDLKRLRFSLLIRKLTNIFSI